MRTLARVNAQWRRGWEPVIGPGLYGLDIGERLGSSAVSHHSRAIDKLREYRKQNSAIDNSQGAATRHVHHPRQALTALNDRELLELKKVTASICGDVHRRGQLTAGAAGWPAWFKVRYEEQSSLREWTYRGLGRGSTARLLPAR